MSVYTELMLAMKFEAELRRCRLDRETARALVAMVQAEGLDAFQIIMSMIDPSTGCGTGPTFDCIDADVCEVPGGGGGLPTPPFEPRPPVPADPSSPTPVDPPPQAEDALVPTDPDKNVCQWMINNLCHKMWFDLVLAVVAIKAPTGSRAWRAGRAAQAVCAGAELCDDRKGLTWDMIIDLICFATSMLATMTQAELESVLTKFAANAKYALKVSRLMAWFKKNKIGRLVALIPGVWLVFCELWYLTYGHDQGTGENYLPEWMHDLPLPGLPPVLMDPQYWNGVSPEEATWNGTWRTPPPPGTVGGHMPRYALQPGWGGLESDINDGALMDQAVATWQQANRAGLTLKAAEWEQWNEVHAMFKQWVISENVPPNLVKWLIDPRFVARRPSNEETTLAKTSRRMRTPVGLNSPGLITT